MELNLFLWPMILPMIIPILYCIKYKKQSLVSIGALTVVMILIVFLYWPLIISDLFGDYNYLIIKFFLFVLLPILFIQAMSQKKTVIDFKSYGIKKSGLKKSLLLFFVFLPIMLVASIIIQIINGYSNDSNLFFGTIMFFEAFTEEFFFRGILFFYLLKKTNFQISYITSLTCFILVHPQNLSSILIIGTIIQGILTLEICRRSNNLIGAWLIHGTNRFFTMAIMPFLI